MNNPDVPTPERDESPPLPPRQPYTSPILEVHPTFVTVTGVTVSIGALFDDLEGGE
jgi:hypothetical protein